MSQVSFDAVDAQLFGRILPPYMLKQNVKHAGDLCELSMSIPCPEIDLNSGGIDMEYMDPADYALVMDNLDQF